jgi:ABC-type sugar transport system ATPase subunit
MPGLRLEGLSKSYDEIAAVRDVDLTADSGELLVVVGPSGCGKSTLLRAIAGLETVDAGVIHIGDRDVTRARPAARNVSMVFQSYALFPHLTAAENIGFGLVVREEPKRVVREKVTAAAALVGCTYLLDRRPSQLSGGERQRVALARALVREPDVFLLDEPLSNLDAGLRAEMRTELKHLHARVGATMVFVTHDQVEALTLGDRIAVMDSGVIRQVGKPDEVFGAPADRFVARFLGTPTMNIVPPAVLHLDGVPPGVEAGVRPEHVRLTPAGTVEGRVVLIEPVGSEAYVHLRVGDTPVIARVPSETRPALGEDVSVEVRRVDVHLFDRESGKRVEWT